MEPAELILYATPCGALAERCDSYFRRVVALGPTTAQTYPPHCTLTGFFRRPARSVDVVIGEVADTVAQLGLDARGRVDGSAVGVSGPTLEGDWLGLVVTSPRLADVAARFAARHVADPGQGDDPIRLKSWLHLSLAYGHQITQSGQPRAQVSHFDRYLELADDVFAGPSGDDWEIGLWRRLEVRLWQRLWPA